MKMISHIGSLMQKRDSRSKHGTLEEVPWIGALCGLGILDLTYY